MATLTGKTIANTYKDLLQVSNNNNGLTGTVQTISDGAGTNSALQLSNAAVNINGTFQLNGESLTVNASAINNMADIGSATGIIVVNSGSVYGRTLTAGAPVSITNANGTAGNPTITLASIANVSGSYGPFTNFGVNDYGQIVSATAVSTSVSVPTIRATELIAQTLTLSSNASIVGNVNVDGTFIVDGIVSAASDVAVGGSLYVTSNISVTGNTKTNFLQAVSASIGKLNVGTLAYELVSVSALTANTLTVVSAATFNSDVTFTGASYNAVWDKSDNALEFGDSARLIFGTGADLTIYHDGSNSYITESGDETGSLNIKGTNLFLLDADNEYKVGAVSGGAVTLYHDNSAAKLATTSTGINVTGNVSATGFYGDGANLTNIPAPSSVSSFTINQLAVVSSAAFSCNVTATAFYGDGSNLTNLPTAPVSVSAYTVNQLTVVSVADFADNVKAKFGNSGDLEIYAASGGSYIKDVGSGSFNIMGTNLFLLDAAGEYKVGAVSGGAVTLYHDNSAAKLATKSDGIDVTGELQADSLDIDGNSQLDGTLTVGVDDTGYDVKFYGDTASRYWLWDTSADGVVQRGTLTIGVDDAGHDVKFFGDTASAYMLWDASQDDLILGGAARLGIGVTSPLFPSTIAGADGATNMMLQSTAGLYRLGFYNDSSQQRISTYNTTALTFAITESEKMRLDTGGRFLINKSTTQTANAPLQIASALGTGQVFVGNTSGTGYMFGRDNVTTGNFVLGEVSNDSDTSVTNYLNIATGTGNATFIGMVGVGVVPTEELHIKASDPTIRLEDSDTAGLGSFISGESGNLLLQSYNANRDIIFGENAAGGEIMCVTGLGSVGIGTSAPGAELEIAGDYQPLIVNSTNSSGAKIVFEDNGVTRGYIGGASSMPVTFYNSSATLLGGFDTNGRFGIGTSTPTSPLTAHGYTSGVGVIYGNAGAASQHLITLTDGVATNFSIVTSGTVLTLGSDAGSNQTAIKSSGVEAIRIDSSQRVGIGTSTPDSNHKLEVYSTGTTEVAIRSGNSSEAIINFGDVASRLRGRIAYNNSSEYLAFWANAGEKMRIDSSGNLIVKPASSSQTISVEASGGGAKIEMQADGGTLTTVGSTNNVPTAIQANSSEAVRVLTDGKVGIGTTSPSAKLEVNGTVLASTDTDTSNTGSVTLDFSANQNFVLTLTGNVTLANPSTEQVGQAGVMVFIQDGTGSRTLSLGSDYETAEGAGITLSTAANAVDIVPYFVKASGSIQLGAPQLAFS